MMRLQLAKPCKNCPFSVAKTRIRFSCRERAEEIEELAYRQGFPCHLSATLDEDDEDAGYEFGPNTQHCAGAALMFLNEGYDTWPGIDNRELSEAWVWRLEPNLGLAFACAEDFYEANKKRGGLMQGHRTYLDLSSQPDMRAGFMLAPSKSGHREFSAPLAMTRRLGLQPPARAGCSAA